MGWFWKSTRGAWDLANVERPWQQGKSIHDHISEHIAPGVRGLTPGGERLPDENDNGGVKWAAGALDGVFGHHMGRGTETARAKMLHRSLRVVLEDATPVKLKTFYRHLLEAGVMDIIDPLLEEVSATSDIDVGRLEELALWIARNAPDREPVKFAIAILGVIDGPDHRDLLSMLGRHEEFTLYAAVALSNRAGDDAERMLFELATHVDGWGRIHLVERLSATSNPAIKRWMLRAGYKNWIMYEYLAFICASTGGLRAELNQESVDPELLAGAGDIIHALINGGPAESIDDYDDGAAVVERYLHHLARRPGELKELVIVDRIRSFLEEDSHREAREKRGWTPALREQLKERTAAFTSQPHWTQTVVAGLSSESAYTYFTSADAAKALGIDPWDNHFARLESGADDAWYFVIQTDDPARVARVVALAQKNLPLDEIATGPAEEFGLGKEWSAHGNLDFVLQVLRRFPGQGWPLVRAGIRSPVVRNRNFALRALSAWGMDAWPPDAKALLETALREEPNQEVRESLEALLAGRELSDR